MKLRAFLLTLLGAIAAAFTPRPKPGVMLVWVDEETEVFVAPNLEALNKWLGREPAKREVWDEPWLTAENKGEAWGEADWDDQVQDEDGTIRAFREEVALFEKQPWFRRLRTVQLSTQYN